MVDSSLEPDKTKKHIFLGDTRICTITNNSSLVTYNYFHGDHLGSSNLITDESGNIVQLCEYAPYGEFSKNELADSQTRSPANYYFTGKELDDSTGLYFFGARYYDPEIGRFITPDTIVQAPYDPQSLNRYSYCRNNPINLVDSTGHKWSWKKFWHSFAGAFLGAVISFVTAGLGAPLWAAGMAGGFFGGALTGGLEGGWKGALFGGLIGGALGGLGGWGLGIAQAHKMTGQFIAGTLIAGAGVAGATDSWDSFAGGLTGGIAGAIVGGGIVNSEQFQNWKAGDGFVSNKDNPKITTKISSEKLKIPGTDIETDKIDIWVEADKKGITYKAGDMEQNKTLAGIKETNKGDITYYGRDSKIDAILRVGNGNQPTKAIINIDQGKTIYWTDINKDGKIIDYNVTAEGIKPEVQKGEVVIK